MEVHHHHSGTHEGPRHFKEYFKEFLMIFLAVSLGFFAENVREILSDNNHVEELVGQLKDDLINDTVKIEKHIVAEAIQMKRADSVYAILMSPLKQMDFIELQKLLIACDYIDPFYPSTGAMSTIKTELHLKKFVKTKISAHIDDYEKGITVLQTLENRDIDYMGKFLETFMSNHFTPENAFAAVNHTPYVSNSLRNITAADLVQLSVDINLIKAYHQQLFNRYKEIKADATLFIAHINSTYSLDD
jgi:hypothetical protein